MNIVTVRKDKQNGWIVNDRKVKNNTKNLPSFTRKVEAVRTAKGIARKRHGVFAIINDHNEPLEVMNYSGRINFVKDKIRRNKILKAVVKTSIQHPA